MLPPAVMGGYRKPIIHKNEKFCFHIYLASGLTRWRCTKNQCKAFIKLDPSNNNAVVEERLNHQHNRSSQPSNFVIKDCQSRSGAGCEVTSFHLGRKFDEMNTIPIINHENMKQAIDREIEEKTEITNLVDTIRKKYSNLRHNAQTYHQAMEKKFEPLINAITTTANTRAATDLKKNEENQPLPLEDAHLEDFHYGIHRIFVKGKTKYYLGKYPIRLTVKSISIGGKDFETTPGLLELLTKKRPENFTPNDERNYKSILVISGIHKTQYGDLKNYNDYKTKFIIRPLFTDNYEEDADDEVTDVDINAPTFVEKPEPVADGDDYNKAPIFETQVDHDNMDDDDEDPFETPDRFETPTNRRRSLIPHQGSHKPVKRILPPRLVKKDMKYGKAYIPPPSLPFMKPFVSTQYSSMTPFVPAQYCAVVANGFGDYVYWDDPNELVERLVLLHASYNAGNNNVLKEIRKIEKELRKAKIIE